MLALPAVAGIKSGLTGVPAAAPTYNGFVGEKAVLSTLPPMGGEAATAGGIMTAGLLCGTIIIGVGAARGAPTTRPGAGTKHHRDDIRM